MNRTPQAALLSALLAIGAAVAVRADDAMTVDQKLNRLTQELDLTDNQRETLRSVLEEQKARKEAARTESERKSVHEETRLRVRGLLTEEQRLRYDRMKDGKKSGKPAAPAMPPDSTSY